LEFCEDELTLLELEKLQFKKSVEILRLTNIQPVPSKFDHTQFELK